MISVNPETGEKIEAELAETNTVYTGTVVTVAVERIAQPGAWPQGMSFLQIRPAEGNDILIPGDLRMLEHILDDLKGEKVEARYTDEGWMIIPAEGQ